MTVHGEEAVHRFRRKKRTKGAARRPTMAGFIERSKKYRGLGLKIPSRTRIKTRFDPVFDEEDA